MRLRTLLVMSSLALAGLASPALAVDTIGLFELDGNAVSDGGHDWANITSDTAVRVTDIPIADPAPLSIYWRGGSKDIEDTTAWAWKDGSVPDKDDITNAYAAAFLCPNDSPGTCAKDDLIIYFGADRYANNGDAFLGFWFFQEEIGLFPPDDFGPGQHRVGDMLVLVEFPQASGAHPLIKVLEWNPDEANVANNLKLVFDSEDAPCDGDPTNPKYACAITNLGSETAPWPYLAKDGSPFFPYESFFEGGVNVTQLLGSSRCFSSFLAETRSSHSETAQLKDFVLGGFELCAFEVTKACEASLDASGNGFTVTFEGLVDNTGFLPLEIVVEDDVGDIDDVCLWVSGACAGPPPGLGLAGGAASFILPSGASAKVMGSYATSEPAGHDPVTGLFTLTDTLAATAKELDGTPVGDTEYATALCETIGVPDIWVTKDCDQASLNEAGNELLVEFHGTVENTGQVKLVNVRLADTTPLAQPLLSLVTCFDDDLDGDCTEADTLLCLNPTQCATVGFSLDADAPPALFVGSWANATDLVTYDVVTATAESYFDVTDTVEASDDAGCSTAFEASLDVTKVCDVALDDSAQSGYLVVKVTVSGVLSNTGDIEITGGVLEDSVLGVIASDLLLPPGTSTPYSVYYYPSSYTAGLHDYDASDTMTASGEGALGLVVAPVQISAACSLCIDPLAL
ncbi:MAG: hypothetical protein P1V51_02345 [Deltaproteobacteria bacterium]|nr:hypothetical protein [Deltaproteobacteria bacterium]